MINTILWDNMPTEINLDDGSVSATYSNICGGYPGVGNISAYPYFADVNDYHLSDYSPCIGAGMMTQDVPDTDIEGNPRPYPGGSAPDIGAYESNRSAPLPPPARRNIHISTTGSDETGKGSSDNPYLTIQKGIDEAFDGDTVLVADGTYIENLRFHGKAITVESASGDPELCIIDGDSEDDAVITFRAGEATDSVLRGFTIQNSKAKSHGRGIYCWNSSPTIANNMITGVSGASITCSYSSPIITSNVISDNSGGISCGNSSPTIAGNTITGNLSSGISFYDSSIVISNNAIAGNSGDGIRCSSSSAIIVSNMITGNSGIGIHCSSNSSVTAINNTIVDNGSDWCGGIYCHKSTATIVNTIVWNHASPEIYPQLSSIKVSYSNVRAGYPGVGNIDAYPLFVGIDDYHLSDYSPCIGAGIMTQDMPATDIEGNPRPSPAGSAPDIGTYESNRGAPLPPPARRTIHISTTGSDETGDGSPDNPYSTIQKGIDEAFDGDTILVDDGTYIESLNFYGKAITVESASGDPEMCIIDGGGENLVITFDSGEDKDSVLRGFTIQNGKAIYNRGGIYCLNSSPTIDSNIIKDNTGTGISCSDSSPVITYNIVSGNLGGISCSDSSPIVTGNIVASNQHAGISCSNGSPTIARNTIKSNSDAGISCSSGSPTIARNTIKSNSGAGISCSDSSPIINANIVADNSNGIHCSSNSSAIITNNMITGNSSGIYCAYNSSATITSNTIAGNGVGVQCSYKSSATIINTILWGNMPQEISPGDGSINITYSNVRGGYPGVGNIDEYPRFVGIDDYHLSDYSLCIGAGMMTQDVPDTDIEGNPRPNPAGSSPDMGAYESILGQPLPRPPATIHVSTTGNDITGNGSSDNPYLTIQKGIDEAFDGDTVLVADGTYIVENLRFHGKAIIVESASGDPDSCIIDGGDKGCVVTFNSGEATDSVLRGFTIQNGEVSCWYSSPTIASNMITGNSGAGIQCSGSSPVITDNVVSGNSGSGILCSDSSPIITGNIIASNRYVGISCSNSSPTITKNTIKSNSETGITCYDSSPIITGNTVASNSDAGIRCGGSSAIIASNMITGNPGGGIHCSSSSSVTVINNTIVGNRSYRCGGIYCSYSSATIVNTILWNDVTPEIYLERSSIEVTYSNVRGGYTGTGNISAYPRLEGVNDYHLSDYSPCIGAGTMTQDVPDTDIEGNPRPNPAGSAPDMGAYESNRGAPLPPPARRTIHISTTGSDETGDGSSDNPYSTIRKGIDEAFDGDTVLVDDGTYIENLNFYGKAITVESASGDREMCIIDGGSKDHVVIFDSGEDEDSVMRGFTIQNGGRGLYCWNSSPTIASNMITGNSGTGISCSGSSPTIVNNMIAGNPGTAIYCSSNSFATLINNTIAENNSGGISCSSDSTIVVFNTILWGNMPQEIFPGDGSINITYSNVRGGYPGVGNIDAYPRFAGADDYHLSDYSLCIGAGMMTQDVPDADIEGNPRPNPAVSNPDIGAYENSLGQPLPRPPATIHVSTTGSDETGDGSSGNPYLTIQKGIDEALDGDTVLVADGTYVENPVFPGKDISVESASGNPEYCIVDGDREGNVVTFNSGEDTGSVLRGFTIQNGRPDQRGGAIYCWNSSPNIVSNIVTGNLGAGISCYDSSPIISNNVVMGNEAGWPGGAGIYCNESSSPIIVNNIIVGNKANHGNGGGICCTGNSSSIIINNVIAGNNAEDGGGIYCGYGSSPIISNNTISGNRADDIGGGLFCRTPSTVVINTILWDNMPQEIYQAYPGGGNVNVTYSVIQGDYPGVGNIDVYPRFAGVNDYHLSDYNPCIGAGKMTQDVPDTDIEGNPRPSPVGSAPDIGAYENRLGVPLPPRPTPITIHISTTGSDDTGDGSPDNPYLTIQRGIMEAFDGDTILVADGTYVENLTFHGKAITVESVSSNPELCIIDGDRKDSVVTFRNSEGADSVLSGFTIQNGSGGVYCYSSSPVISSNIIKGNRYYRIYSSHSSYQSNGGGICCYNSSPVIDNNVIVENRSGGGISCLYSSSATVVNNTIVGNDKGGISCSQDSFITVINSIFWGNMPQEINAYADDVNVTYSNVRGGYPGVGNIDVYPRFAGVGDYHLSDCSPCIGAGIMTQDVPDTDIEGNPRPYPGGSAPDMGAYENRLDVPLPPRPTPIIIHISTTGSDDTGDGSPGNPYFTIQRGIMEAFDGDTVLVADGTYMENPSFHGKAITVQSVNSNPKVCIIDGDSRDSVVTFRNSEGADSILRGFTIQNSNRGIYCWNSSPTLAGNIITGNSSIGIHCDNSSTIITSNIITGNPDTGIYCYRSSPIITSNTITGNPGTGIYCSESSSIITSNIITGNSHTGIYCYYGSSPIITNNIITGNSGTAISCLYDSSATVISNTIAGNNGSNTGGISCYRSSATVINTILWDNMPQEIRSSTGSVNVTYSVVRGGYPGVGNIDAYPNFAGVNDYHLSAYSPCIGAGIMTQDVPDTDIEGNPRPNPAGSNPDIGAYESSLSERASITIVSPNGGEAWSGGSSREITWQTSVSNTDYVRLLYSSDSGDTYPNTIVSSTPNNGKYEWNPVPTLDSAQIRVKAILEDSSGNVLATDATDADFIIDSTAPDTSIALSGTAGENGWYTSDVAVTLSATDSLSGVKETKYRIDDGTWKIYSLPFTLTGSTVYYYSEDNAGNAEAEKPIEVRIDKVAPETTATLSGTEGENGWYTSDVIVTLSATDDGSGVKETKYRIDDGPWKTYSLPFTVTGSTVHYYSEDNAGNAEVEKSIQVKIDKVAPETTTTLSGTEGENGWYVSDVTVTLSATDDGSGISETKYRIDDGIWRTYSLPFTLTGSTVHYYSEDNAGNTEAEKSMEVRIDKVAPETTATLSGTEGENGWYISDVTVTLSATDSLSGVKETKYKVISGSWETYSKPFAVSDSTNRATVYYLSEDNAGNTEAVKSQQMKIDKTAPSTPVVTDDGDHLPSTNQLHASWTSSDAQSGVVEYQYAIGTTPGGADVTNWTSTGKEKEVTVTGLSLTSGRLYYFAVKARNGAGLWSDAGASDGIAKRAELLTASYDLQNSMLTLTFTDPIDPGPARFDGIGMEVNDSGQWDFVLSDRLGLKVRETVPSKEINIDIKRAYIVASSLARAFINHRKVDILLKPIAFTDTFGLNIQEVVGTDDIEIQMISDGFMLGTVGDVNGNGEVTVDDAELILRSTIHGPTIFPIYNVASNIGEQLAAYGYSYDVMMGAADADSSGDISSYDSAMVFRWSAGLGNLAPGLNSNLRKSKLSVNDYDERELEVSIDVDDVSDVYSADIVMTYDPQQLLLSDASRTSSTSGWLFEHGTELTASRSITSLRISLAGASQPSSNGSLITLSFDVLSADAVRELDIVKLKLNGGMIKASIENLPRAFALLQNYPNPFNPETWIPYQLTEVADVTITIYSVNGQIVRQLELGSKMPGHYVDRQRAAYWDSRNEWGESVSSGIYFYVIQAGTHTDMRKMLMLK